jgi:hypothetical protein
MVGGWWLLVNERFGLVCATYVHDKIPAFAGMTKRFSWRAGEGWGMVRRARRAFGNVLLLRAQNWQRCHLAKSKLSQRIFTCLQKKHTWDGERFLGDFMD